MSKRRQRRRGKRSGKATRIGNAFRWSGVLVVLAVIARLAWELTRAEPFQRVPVLNDAARQLRLKWSELVATNFLLPATNALAEKPARQSTPIQTLKPPEPVEVQVPQTAPVPPPAPPGPAVPTGPDSANTTLAAQIALMRLAISPGVVDGVMGLQTRAALRAFQQHERLPVTGTLDDATRARLRTGEPLFVDYIVTPQDLARLEPLSGTWLGKSQQRALEYESVLELVSEQSRSHPSLVRSLNPGLDWDRVEPGTRLRLPNTSRPEPQVSAAFLLISLSDRTLQAYDSGTNLLAHFPCSIGRVASKRPTGELCVEVRIEDPNYTFNPAIFPESAEGRELGRRLVVPPGPNNPVGTVWLGLNKPAYGIHGTPIPEHVGRTESHGCFRLANWDAEYLIKLVGNGTPVRIEE